MNEVFPVFQIKNVRITKIIKKFRESAFFSCIDDGEIDLKEDNEQYQECFLGKNPELFDECISYYSKYPKKVLEIITSLGITFFKASINFSNIRYAIFCVQILEIAFKNDQKIENAYFSGSSFDELCELCVDELTTDIMNYMIRFIMLSPMSIDVCLSSGAFSALFSLTDIANQSHEIQQLFCVLFHHVLIRISEPERHQIIINLVKEQALCLFNVISEEIIDLYPNVLRIIYQSMLLTDMKFSFSSFISEGYLDVMLGYYDYGLFNEDMGFQTRSTTASLLEILTKIGIWDDIIKTHMNQRFLVQWIRKRYDDAPNSIRKKFMRTITYLVLYSPSNCFESYIEGFLTIAIEEFVQSEYRMKKVGSLYIMALCLYIDQKYISEVFLSNSLIHQLLVFLEDEKSLDFVESVVLSIYKIVTLVSYWPDSTRINFISSCFDDHTLSMIHSISQSPEYPDRISRLIYKIMDMII